MADTDETLKTLRFLNQLLMILATAVLLFGVASDPTREYNAALDELSALRKVTDSMPDYGEYLHDRFKASQPSDKDFLLGAIKEATAYAGERSEFRQPFACDCIPTSFSLAAYDAFLSGVRAFAPIHIDHNRNLPSQLKAQIGTQRPHPGFVFVRASFNGVSGSYQLRDGTSVLRLGDPGPYETTVQFTFDDPQSKSRPSFSANVFVRYSLGPKQEGTFALDWLRTTKAGEPLVDKSGVVLPYVKKLSFWNRISSLGIEQATASVQANLDHLETGKVSFLGISVDKVLAVWLGPTVCAALLFYFLLHLKRFCSLVDSVGIDTRFPWVPLFPGVLSGIFSHLFLFLPFVASLVLLLNHGDSRQWSTRIGAAVTAGIFLLGALSSLAIRRIRSRVKLSASS